MYVLPFTIRATCTATGRLSAVGVQLITFWCYNRFREVFFGLNRNNISHCWRILCWERERESVVKLETWTQFTAVHCHICIYTYKLLYTTGSLMEFELTLRNCLHVTLYNSTLYELPWNLLIWVHPVLEFKIFLHISGHVFLRLDLVFLVDISFMDLLIGAVFGHMLKLSV
jgi:hypothetical protein